MAANERARVRKARCFMKPPGTLIYPLFSLLLTIFFAGCSDNNSSDNGNPPPPPSLYQASVVRTENGIPHVTAKDWGSLGYGYGYAFAQDNYCVLMKEILYASGQSAQFLGEEGDLDSDFVYQWVNGDEDSLRTDWLETQEERLQQLAVGYAAGVSRYFNETGVEQLAAGPEGCRDAAWARTIDEIDLVRVYRKSLLKAGIDNGILRRGITDVSGPGSAQTSAAAVPDLLRKAAGNRFRGFIDPAGGGSNALALGADYTQSGTAILLGNPHQPWQGTGRWHQLHLTIPGEYDAMGATLLGLPMVTIGFNKDIAWSHTVTPASHVGFYELQLHPDNPLQYLYDGEYRDITSQQVTAQRLEADGTLSEHSFTIYLSHYGPIVNLRRQSPLLDGWPMFSGSILSVRDPNLNNPRAFLQWITMAQASNMAEFSDALKPIGLPWVHTVAADRHGDVLYADASVIPRVTAEQLDSCIDTFITSAVTSLANRLFFALNGSRSDCEWGRSPDSPEGTNVYGYSELPSLNNRSYLLNSNNSYWLANADTPLTGFPFLMGPLGGEEEQQFLRGNLGHQMVAERMAASDGLDDSPGFNVQNLQGMMLSNRVLSAEMALDDVLFICAEAQQKQQLDSRSIEACTVLASWDLRVNLDSRGAHIFTEFWRAFADNNNSRGSYFIENPEIWRQPFDPAKPTTTPAGIDTAVPANHERVLTALAHALEQLAAAGVELDLPFSEVQYVTRNQLTIPIHGGWDEMGTFSVIKVRLEEGGYRNVTGGNSYIQTVTWDESECPVAQGLVAHSQSTDPESPYYADQTQLYSDKIWPVLPFCNDDIEQLQVGETLLLEE